MRDEESKVKGSENEPSYSTSKENAQTNYYTSIKQDDAISKGYYQDEYSQNENFSKCKLDKFQRVRFFTGQLLLPDDLIQLTRYFNDKRHLINQQIIGGNGIVCGLDINILEYLQDCLTVSISSGFAIDCCGKEIVVPKDKIHEIEIPEKFLNEKTKRLGLFIARKEVKRATSDMVISECGCDGEYPSTETRIEEGYRLFLKHIDQNLLGLEFDKNNYCLNEKVRIEVWDPDNRLQHNNDSISIKVKSTLDQTGINLLLNKTKDNQNFYRGEFVISDKTSVDNSQLKVKKNDTITAYLNDNLFESAFVNSTDSFIYNQRKIIHSYYQRNQMECKNCSNLIGSAFSNDKHAILIGIAKINSMNQDEKQQQKQHPNIVLDMEESLLCKNVIYNNQMLYDLCTNKAPCSTPNESNLNNSTVIISEAIEYSINDIDPGTFKINPRIDIFDKYSMFKNRELEFPPLVYLGREISISKHKFSFNEDIYIDKKERLVIDGQSFVPSANHNESLQWLKDNYTLFNSSLFKPVDIDSQQKSFSILLARIGHDTTDKTTKEQGTLKDDKKSGSTAGDEATDNITIRWWAVCKFKVEDNEKI